MHRENGACRDAILKFYVLVLPFSYSFQKNIVSTKNFRKSNTTIFCKLQLISHIPETVNRLLLKIFAFGKHNFLFLQFCQYVKRIMFVFRSVVKFGLEDKYFSRPARIVVQAQRYLFDYDVGQVDFSADDHVRQIGRPVFRWLA